MPKQQYDALVTEGLNRQALSIVRSLGRAGKSIAVAETTHFSIAGYSKYCKLRLTYPSPRHCRELFLKKLIELLKQYKFNILIPSGDIVSQILVEEQDHIRQYTNIILPGPQEYKIARDKAETAIFAQKHNIPVPHTLCPTSIDDVIRQKKALNYPVLIKPRESAGSRGIKKIYNPDELVNNYKQIHSQYPWPIIQEHIPTNEPIHDISFLVDKGGRIIATFQSKRIRMYPVEGGPMTCWESIYEQPLDLIGRQILANLRWTGVLHMEFLRHPETGEFYLIEINPRFWGAVELAVASGINFPEMYYRLAMGEDLTPVEGKYPLGKIGRWILPGEILHLLSSKRRMSLKEFFDFSDPDVAYSVLSKDDPAPILGFFLATLRHLFSWEKWKFVVWR